MDEEVRVLFHKLVDLSASQRQAYYAQQQVPDAVRVELESLLRFDGTPGDTLTGVVGSAAEQFLRSHAPVAEDGRCGPYRLVRLLGTGGMVSVYLAERADGELEQRVAIKFLRAGTDLPSFRDRFLRERQILASLNHPGIARLLDAGHIGGQPYLVMEFVDGTCIDYFASGLDLRTVLTLFLHVCEAVSHAHRKLIIHRDLKPSNILIDSAGQPKLLDFGMAKILDAPEETRTLEKLLTPEYASPEQLRGDAQATTTDVYSLGAVLFRLLTGESPHPPAVRNGQDLPEDLECVLGKAMRNEPEERYATVDALCDDVRAYLEHRPVRARRGNAWYHTRMFMRRHWLPVAAVIRKRFAKRPRFHVHFTPAYGSWINLVERWFAEITNKRIRRGVFRSVKGKRRSTSSSPCTTRNPSPSSEPERRIRSSTESLDLPSARSLSDPPDLCYEPLGQETMSLLAVNAIDALGAKARPWKATIAVLPATDQEIPQKLNGYVPRLLENIALNLG